MNNMEDRIVKILKEKADKNELYLVDYGVRVFFEDKHIHHHQFKPLAKSINDMYVGKIKELQDKLIECHNKNTELKGDIARGKETK